MRSRPEERSAASPAAAPIDPLKEAHHLLSLGLGPAAGEQPGDTLGDYELEKEIGRGASCVVYQARLPGIHRRVALKLMTDAELATPEERRRFRDGARAAADLDHPNIVPVLHVGEHGGRPFFTMKLIEGGTLEGALDRLRRTPFQGAALLATIARAVDHAHTQGRRVLHLDLKPANILLDQQGAPHVADFGLARSIDRRASVVGESNFVGGTLRYMAPEQPSGDSRKLSCATDVYSLGSILYELLTGRVPYPQRPAELLQRLCGPEPVPPPRQLAPDVDRDLENICLKCLEKDPARRYQSAKDLADDLDRACAGLRPLAHRSRGARAVDWMRRHPRLSALCTGAALLTLTLAVAALFSWRGYERERKSLLENNAFIASGQAGAVLVQFRDYADRVAQLAREPFVRAYLELGHATDPAPALKPAAYGFDELLVMDPRGRIQAQWPSPTPHVFERAYTFRDYFIGALRLAASGSTGAYVSRAFRSESHGLLDFAFSSPILGKDGALMGVVVGTLNAKSGLGAVTLEDAAETGHITTALLGPRGNDRGPAPEGRPRAAFTFLAHPGLARGVEVELKPPRPSSPHGAFGPAGQPGRQLAFRYAPPLKVPDFRDPVLGTPGPWLAAFAPVGDTGFVVLVERKDEAPRWTRLRPEKLATPSRLALAGGVVLLLAAAVAVLGLAVASRAAGRRRP